MVSSFENMELNFMKQASFWVCLLYLHSCDCYYSHVSGVRTYINIISEFKDYYFVMLMWRLLLDLFMKYLSYYCCDA